MDTMTLTAEETKLTEFDFIVCVDASGSMSETDCPNGTTRWGYMQESLLSFTRDICKLDSDGIGLVTFGGANVTSDDGVTADKVKEVFASRQPRGATPLTEGLIAALALANKSSKKAFILVFTDGVPDNQASAADVIRKQSNSQATDDRCTILFVQVGRDPSATAYLHQLDDSLSGAKFDIVSAKTIDEAEKFPSTSALVLHAISN